MIEVSEAFYTERDFNEDGSPDDKVWLPERKPGNYSIQVIPEVGANTSDTFTLTVSPMEQKWGYTPIIVAQNITISDIPTEPYTFEFKQRTTTNLSYTGTRSGYNLDIINLIAVLSTENGSPLSGKKVNFVIGNQSASAVTDSNGIASASLTFNQNPSEFYFVEYGFDGDMDYLPYYDDQPFVIPPIADVGGPYTGNEGSSIMLNGSDTYDPEDRVISYEWDLDNNGVYEDATGVTPAYTWEDDYSNSIGLSVTDDNGTISTATTTVTVNNVPPTVEAGADVNNAIAGTAINFNGSFTDPGCLDTHTIVWNFGDGSPTVNGTLTPTHTYTSIGNYTVTLTITDDDSGVGIDTLVANVISPTPPTTTYTFASGGSINKWCSAGHIHLIDWLWGHPHSPSDFSDFPTYGFVSSGNTQYTQVSSSNNVWWKSNISHCLGCCAFDRNAELFTFKIAENPSTITNIQIKWEGHGTTGKTIYYTTEKLWKASSNSWNTLHNQANITSDITWTNNISSNCADYIDGTGNLSVLIAAQRSGLPNNCGIWTDYIEVTITHNQ
jgi:PKD repeat protein